MGVLFTSSLELFGLCAEKLLRNVIGGIDCALSSVALEEIEDAEDDNDEEREGEEVEGEEGEEGEEGGEEEKWW